jgi:hypothetical protein
MKVIVATAIPRFRIRIPQARQNWLPRLRSGCTDRAEIGDPLDNSLEMLVEIAAEEAGPVIATARLLDGGEVFAPAFRGHAGELFDGWSSATGELESREQEGAIADGTTRSGLVAGDETFVASRVAEYALEVVVGAREFGVVVAGEDLRAEDPGCGKHVLERGFTGRLGVTLNGGADVAKEFLEGALDGSRRSLLSQELGGTLDEATEETDVTRRGGRDAQSDGDVLTELLEKERSTPFFLSPASSASWTCWRRSRVSSPGAWRG